MSPWLFALALVVPVSAEPLSLDAAVARAVVHHPDVVRAGLLREQSEAALVSARAAWDPVATGSLAADTANTQGFVAGYPSSSDSRGWDAQLGVGGEAPSATSWDVTTSFDRQIASTLAAFGGGPAVEQRQETWSARVDASLTQDLLVFLRSSPARIEVRQAVERLDDAELTLLQSTQGAAVAVAEAWWAWWTAEQRVGLARATLDAAVALQARTEAWFAVGQVARLEVDRVTAERLGAERDLDRAAAAARAAEDDVRVLLDLPAALDLEPVGDERPWRVADLDAVEAGAPPGNFDLALARLAVARAEASERDARDRGLPSLDLTGTVGVATLTERAGEAFAGLTGADNQPRASIALTAAVPLGGRGAQGAREGAALQVAIERAALEATTRAVEADLRAAVDDLRTATRGVELAEARLAVARSTEAGEQARVDAGTRRLDELLDATRARQSAEIDRITAGVEVGRAELTLARLSGRVLAEVIDAP